MTALKRQKGETLDKVWIRIFKHFGILHEVNNNSYFDITAEELKQFAEPRLLCKIDYRNKLPTPFKTNDLSILAIQNGLYRIAKTDPFFSINLGKIGKLPILVKELPNFITTIDVLNISGESQALDAACASGILADFQGEKSVLTIRGRRRSGKFSFKLSSDVLEVEYPIDSVQIEVDGGYEGNTSVLLIEAKNTVSKSMNIRQILYPQVHFENQYKKQILSAILFYDRKTRVFNFIPLSFNGTIITPNYTKTKRYKLRPPVTKKIIQTPPLLFSKGKILTDNNIPFPQANDFSKVLHALEKLVSETPISKDELLSDLDVAVVGRQFNYYTDALKWMKLVEGDNSSLTPTKIAIEISQLPELDKFNALESIIFSDPLANEMLEKEPSNFSVELLKSYGISGTTPARRQSTIKRWKKFFDEYRNSLETDLT